MKQPTNQPSIRQTNQTNKKTTNQPTHKTTNKKQTKQTNCTHGWKQVEVSKIILVLSHIYHIQDNKSKMNNSSN